MWGIVHKCGRCCGWCIMWLIGPKAKPATYISIRYKERYDSTFYTYKVKYGPNTWHSSHVTWVDWYTTDIYLIFCHQFVPFLYLFPLLGTSILKPYFHLDGEKSYCLYSTYQHPVSFCSFTCRSERLNAWASSAFRLIVIYRL